MTRYLGAFVFLAAVMPLAGCNEGTGMSAAPSMAASAAPVVDHRLPPGAPCTNEIDQYSSVVKSDLATGNVEQKVYDKIAGELSKAAAACAAGKGGEAHALVAASKARHGYRA